MILSLPAKKEMNFPVVPALVLANLLLVSMALKDNNFGALWIGLSFGLTVLLTALLIFSLKEMDAFIVLVGVLVISPSIGVIESLPSIRLDDIVLGILLLRALIGDPKGFLQSIRGLWKGLILVSAVVVVSIVYSIIFLDYSPILRDFFEFIRIGRYFAFIVIARLMAEKMSREDKEKLYKNFIFIIFIFVLYCVYQFLNLFNFDTNIASLFTHELHVYSLVKHRRVIGTLENPNMAAFFLGIAITFILSKLIFDRDGQAGWRQRKNIPFALVGLMAFIGLLWTMSRTILLSVLVCALYIGYLAIKTGTLKPKPRDAALVLGGVGVIFAAALLADTQLADRIMSGLRIFADQSFMTRIYKWQEALLYIKESIVFGWGPAKEIFSAAAPVDNEYLLVLRKYGLIGFAVYGWGYFILFRNSGRLIQLPDRRWMGIFIRCMMIILLLYGLTGGILYHMQLMPLFLLLVTLLIQLGSKNNKLLEETS